MHDIYIRVSRTGDRTEEESTEVYEAQCRRWAAEHELQIGEVVEDTNVSGSVRVADRGLERLIQRVVSGESTGIITPYLDRFGRDLIEGAVALKKIADAGGKLIAVRDGFDSTSPGNELMFNLRMAIAQDVLRRTSENFQVSIDRAIADGRHVSRAAFGYRRDEERRLVPDEREEEVVKEMFRRRREGANLRELMDLVRERTGRKISKNGVSTVLRNRIYLGELRSQSGRKGHPKVTKNAHPPMLTEEEWAGAQVNDRGRFIPRTGSTLIGAHLRGLVHCSGCGRRMKVGAYGAPDNRKPTYLCADHDCPAPASIVSHKLDGHVEALLMQAAADHEPHVEAIILGDNRYQDAVRENAEAQQALEDFRDNVRVQQQLGMPSFERGLEVRKAASEVAQRRLSEVGLVSAGGGRARKLPRGKAARRRLIEDGLAEWNYARFVDRVVIERAGRGSRMPVGDRTSVYIHGSEEPLAGPAYVEAPPPR